MTYEIFIFEICLFAAIVVSLSYYFGKWRQQSVAVTIAYTLGWYIPLLIVGVLPIDIASTFYYQNKLIGENANTSSYDASIFVDLNTLNIFWHLVFWSSQLLTWFILPLMQSYSVSGEFTMLRKLRAAFIDNAIYYGSFSVVFICILVYLLIKKTIPFDAYALKLLIITTSNTWGLFLIIIFLGYGLVEVPRAVWRAGFPRSRLRLAYFQLSKDYVEYIEDEEELKTVLQEVREMDMWMPREHPLRPQMDKIVAKTVISMHGDNESVGGILREGISRTVRGQDGSVRGGNPRQVTKQRIVTVHKCLNKALHRYSRATALWLEAIRQAAWFEDIDVNYISGSRVFETGTNPASLCRPVPLERGLYWRRVEWYWKCRIRPLLMRCMGCLLAGLSLLFVWSECTFFIQKPVLSIVAIGLSAQSNYFNYKFMSFVSFAGIGYLGVCTFFTAYRLRIFNYYRLVANHHTDSKSLIFYAMLFSRLTPALCLNFLCLAHLDSHVIPLSPSGINTPNTITILPPENLSISNAILVTEVHQNNFHNRPLVYETAFTAFMGHLDVVPFIADGFNIYFPIAIIFFCLCTFFRLGTRVLHCLGIPQFVMNTDDNGGCHCGNDDSMMTGDSIVENTVQDGKLLLRRQRMISRTRRNCRSQRPKVTIGSGDDASNQFQLAAAPISPNNPITYINCAFEHDEPDRIDGFNEPPMEYLEPNLNSMFNLDLKFDQSPATYFPPSKRHPSAPPSRTSSIFSRVSNSFRNLFPQSTPNRSQHL